VLYLRSFSGALALHKKYAIKSLTSLRSLHIIISENSIGGVKDVKTWSSSN